jgi:hypothetical protein
MDEFPFSKDHIDWSCSRIANTLKLRGELKRYKLQQACSHRHQSSDLFAAALTHLLDIGAVHRTDSGLLFIDPKYDVSVLPTPRKSVPTWDRSGRQWKPTRLP